MSVTILSLRQKKINNLRSTTGHSAGSLRAHHPTFRRRYLCSGNGGILTEEADNKAYRRVNMTACALVPQQAANVGQRLQKDSAAQYKKTTA
jgi:hypothetical protein